MSQITFSQAIQGYQLAVGARHLSTHTINDYANTFKKSTIFLGKDIPIENITHNHIKAFFTAQTKVSNKTLLNYHVDTKLYLINGAYSLRPSPSTSRIAARCKR